MSSEEIRLVVPSFMQINEDMMTNVLPIRSAKWGC